jgi:hypothetical protein
MIYMFQLEGSVRRVIRVVGILVIVIFLKNYIIRCGR